METILIMLTIVMLFLINYENIITRLWKNYRNMMLKRSARIFFEHGYLNDKLFYLHYFKRIPHTADLGGVDAGKVFEYIRANMGNEVTDIYQASSFNRELGKLEFDDTIILLRNQVMIALEGNWVTALYPAKRYPWVADLVKTLDGFRVAEKEQDFEINIITATPRGLELKRMPVKPTVLDLGLYYNDDFVRVDAVIKERLAKNEDKGIVLFHGLPGTGKTTYLRHLVGSLNKKVLFVSPSVAGNMMSPDFIDLLIDNPNSILVIEDAENIMMDRKFNSDSSVSNLLNISDGLLSDCLNVQVICTFNSALNLIDPALMRKGRLIARYEFGKLESKKAQVLSDLLGYGTMIVQPMTLAEITNQHETFEATPKVEVIGFRRREVEMN